MTFRPKRILVAWAGAIGVGVIQAEAGITVGAILFYVITLSYAVTTAIWAWMP